jgi:hypothetical protein
MNPPKELHPLVKATMESHPDSLVVATRGCWRYYYMHRNGLILRTCGKLSRAFDLLISALADIARKQKRKEPLRWAYLTYMAQVQVAVVETKSTKTKKETPHA